MKKRFTILLCLLPLLNYAQSTPAPFGFRYDQSPTVSISGRSLRNPWAGGLNAIQYSTMRLNDDTREDLVVFDRTTNKVSTFVAVDGPTGGTGWQYAPEFEAAFPASNSWLLLVDYDGDGRKDLFTHGAGSIQAFRNNSQNGRVVFEPGTELIAEGFSGMSALYVASSDIPALTDYDDDGDMDVLAFDVLGDRVSYYQNMSIERQKKVGLEFKRQGLCWGNFYKEFCNDFTFGGECEGDVGGRVRARGAKVQHSGNALTVIDTDGDSKKDLLFGFVTCQNIARLRSNGPNNEKATYVSFDSLYPANNPIILPAFPATFWEDVDGDGNKDLLTSPNVNDNEGSIIDFRASSWFYKNIGTNQKPDFQLSRKDFLQNDMVDLGENAAPALADLDGDGDTDMLVGYSGVRVGRGYRAGLWYFENKGTADKAAFELISTDYLGISESIELTNVVPSFADVDGNGSQDLIITGLGGIGLREVLMRVLVNQAPPKSAVRYNVAEARTWSVPDMAAGDVPTVTDVNRDGRPDLLIGKYDGSIHYLRNNGSVETPIFQLQDQQFGGFKVDLFNRGSRSLVVSDLNGDQTDELITASYDGTIRLYQMPTQPDQPLTLLDSLPALGYFGRSIVASAADLDGDRLLDLMVGSRAGGLRYLKNTSQLMIPTGLPVELSQPWAYPNPTDRFLTIRPPYDGQVDVTTLSGQLALPAQAVKIGNQSTIDLGKLPAGVYLIRLTGDGRSTLVRKVVVWR